jgi:hypothetical protein
MKRHIYKSLAILLALSLSCGDLFGASTAGMLRSSGAVSVNGSPVTPLTTVFAGDRIETAPQAVGNLTVGRNSLLLEPNSSMVFSGQSLDFSCGGGTIQANHEITARYGDIVVKPVKDSARFQVQQSGAVVKISALDGNLTLSDGAKSFSLPAGNSINVAYTGCAPLAKSGAEENIASTGISTNGTNLARSIVVPLEAVLSVALAGMIAVSQNPVSPSGP